MKLLLKLSSILIFASASLLLTTSIALFEIPGNSTIYTEDIDQVLESDEISNPIRDGAFKVINAEDGEDEHIIGGLVSVNTQIQNHETAKLQTLDIVRNILNYALGLVSFVALIYLIYHGFLVLTAGGDDTQYKQGLKGLKFAAIAIGGIGLSWIIVSAIFWVIGGAIGGSIE